MIISILYSSLLHYIKHFDTTIAYSLHNADKSGSVARRESRRESIMPSGSGGYQAVEGGSGSGSRVGV
jgi:copper transporter 1